MTTKEEIMLINHRLKEVEDKLKSVDNKIVEMEEKLEAKLDVLIKRLMDPDSGIASRVNQNTHARKSISRALWVLYGIVIASIAKFIWG